MTSRYGARWLNESVAACVSGLTGQEKHGELEYQNLDRTCGVVGRAIQGESSML